MFKSARQLRYWYRKWNKDYFNSELPDNVALWWEPVDGGVAECGYHTATPDGRVPEGCEAYIRIDPAMRGKQSQWGMALLHEMAHIHLRHGQHGQKFEAEMLRLAEAGAMKGLW